MTKKRLWLCLLCLAALGCAGSPKTMGVGLRQEAVAVNDAGYQYYQQGKWDLAQEKFAQALTLNRLIDDRTGMAANLNNLGAIAQEQGDLYRAGAYFREALSMYREEGDPGGQCETLNNLGAVHQAQGRLKEAEEAYREAENWARLLSPGPLTALSLTHLGDIARARGDYQAALGLYEQALQIDTDTKDPRGQAVRRQRLGRTYLDLKDYPKAGALLREALAESRRLESTNGIIDALDGLTRLALAQGDRPEAQIYGERLLKIYEARGQEQEANKLQALLGRGAAVTTSK